MRANRLERTAGRQASSAAVLLVGALVLTACGARPTPVHEFQFFALGTLVEVTLVNVENAPAQEARRTLEGLFRRVGDDWDAWRPGALARFNQRLAGGRPFAVDAVLPGSPGVVVDYTQEADAAFRRFAEAGMHVVRSTEPLEIN